MFMLPKDILVTQSLKKKSLKNTWKFLGKTEKSVLSHTNTYIHTRGTKKDYILSLVNMIINVLILLFYFSCLKLKKIPTPDKNITRKLPRNSSIKY